MRLRITLIHCPGSTAGMRREAGASGKASPARGEAAASMGGGTPTGRASAIQRIPSPPDPPRASWGTGTDGGARNTHLQRGIAVQCEGRWAVGQERILYAGSTIAESGDAADTLYRAPCASRGLGDDDRATCRACHAAWPRGTEAGVGRAPPRRGHGGGRLAPDRHPPAGPAPRPGLDLPAAYRRSSLRSRLRADYSLVLSGAWPEG